MSEDHAHLKIVAQMKKNTALSKIERAKDQLTAEMMDGELKNRIERYPKTLTLAGFCEFAGLGPNFLNGKSHRDTTKPDIKRFLSKLALQLKKSGVRSQQSREDSGDHSKIKELELRCKRLSDQLHCAKELLREKRREVKTLREQIPPRVVAIRHQQS